MVQDDPHPVGNRKGHENGVGYRRQGGGKEDVETIASTQLQGYKNGYGVQEPPPSQRQGNQYQSFMPKPNSNQAQGGSATINHGPYTTQEPLSQRQGSQPQSSMSNTISTQAQGKIGSPIFHQGPSPNNQPPADGARNQPHPTSATTKPHGHASGNDNESRRKPYDVPSHEHSAHYQPPVAPVRRTEDHCHDFEHHDWKNGASHEPKTVPSDALQLDHINGNKEHNKFNTGNGKPLASPTTEMVHDKPRIQVNVNVYYDQDGNCRVDSNPPQPPPTRQAPTSVPAPARNSHVRPPPPKSGSSGCCSIL